MGAIMEDLSAEFATETGRIIWIIDAAKGDAATIIASIKLPRSGRLHHPARVVIFKLVTCRHCRLGERCREGLMWRIEKQKDSEKGDTLMTIIVVLLTLIGRLNYTEY